MLGPCGPRCRVVEGTACLGGRYCGPFIMLLYGARHGESLCSVPVVLGVVSLKARRALVLGPVVLK